MTSDAETKTFIFCAKLNLTYPMVSLVKKERNENMEYVRVDEKKRQWLQPKQLVKEFSLSRSTVGVLLNEMKGHKKYMKSFIRISQRCVLVCVPDFVDFLQARQAE